MSDDEKNKNLQQEIETHLSKLKDQAIIILRDFNGHVRFKDKQNINKNGRRILEWMEKFSLTMLNDELDCVGEVTWRRNEQQSVIDYALVTLKFYDIYQQMHIYEEREIFDLSDHNLIQKKLKIKG